MSSFRAMRRRPKSFGRNQIATITDNAGEAQVATYLPHGLTTGDWVRVANAMPAVVAAMRRVNGALYVPALGGMYQELSGATTAAGSGHPIGEWQDLTGAYPSLFAPSSGARPTVGTGGGLTWVDLDGTDDEMATSAIGDVVFSGTSPTVIAVVQHDGLSGEQAIFGKYGSGAGVLLYKTFGNAYQGILGPSGGAITTAGSIATTSAAVVLTLRSDGAATTLRVDGAVEATGTHSTITDPSTEFRVGNNSNAGRYDGRIYALGVVPSLVSADDLAALETLLGVYGGLSL